MEFGRVVVEVAADDLEVLVTVTDRISGRSRAVRVPGPPNHTAFAAAAREAFRLTATWLSEALEAK